jgi:hypothetical protein
MSDNALVVFTNKSRERILAEGGTSHWVVVPGNVKKLEYVVCTRNSHKAFEQGPKWQIGPEAHGSAFIVGRVSSVDFTYHANGRDRYIVRFSEYAEVSIQNIRSADRRNPVEYVSVETLKVRGLDFDALTFHPMPQVRAEAEAEDEDVGESDVVTSVIDQAKQLIAKALGVPAEAVQLTVQV